MNGKSHTFGYRPARSDDAEAISRLIMSFRNLYTVKADGTGAERFFESVSPEAEREYIISNRYDFLLAEDEDELAGVIAMRDRTHLFHLFISREHQRKGLARELWNRIVEKVRQDRSGLEFTVNSSLYAVPVYERFGFERASPPVQQDGVTFVPMRLRKAGLRARKT